MSKNQVTNRTYIVPEIQIIGMENHIGFMELSFRNNGGHKKVGDDSDELNARQGFFEEEDEEEFEEWNQVKQSWQ